MRTRDARERKVVDYWRRGGLSSSTIQVYLGWIRRFRDYCQQRKLTEVEQLCLSGLGRFARCYSWPRVKGKPGAHTADAASSAVHAWACALRSLGEPVPAWRKLPAVTTALPTPLNEYADYRRAHNGVAKSTLGRDLDTAKQFLKHLRRQRRRLDRIALVDIDAFIQTVAARVSTATVTDTCSSLPRIPTISADDWMPPC